MAMAVASSSASKTKGNKESKEAKKVDSQAKRSKAPGVRVVGGRIYDSENGKTCHQVCLIYLFILLRIPIIESVVFKLRKCLWRVMGG